jgi:hypothetical protein
MIENQENDEFIGNKCIYPVSLTFGWRVIHSTFYCIGGMCFMVASWQYYPSISNLTFGGLLFTIGSTFFSIADFIEWWIVNRIGCFLSSKYLESFEIANSHDFEPNKTCLGLWQRSSNGINFFLSFLGSLLYLIGSVMFIPYFQQIITGIYVFIVASFVIIVSQAWKIIKGGIYSWRIMQFSFLNYNDVPALLVDLNTFFGAVFYLIGSIYFLPDIDKKAADTRESTNFFVIGGVFYVVSCIFIVYRYFFTKKI